MLRNFIAILLVYLFVAVNVQGASAPNNMDGYGKTTWGMSPAEVVKAEAPRAKKLETPEKYETSLGMVTIKEIQIVNTKFSAIFLFKSGKTLQQVNLTSVDENEDTNALSFLSIEQLLTEKYGPPTYKDKTRVVSWKLSKTSIYLRHTNIPNIMSQLTISYKPSSASASAARDL